MKSTKLFLLAKAVGVASCMFTSSAAGFPMLLDPSEADKPKLVYDARSGQFSIDYATLVLTGLGIDSASQSFIVDASSGRPPLPGREFEVRRPDRLASACFISCTQFSGAHHDFGFVLPVGWSEQQVRSDITAEAALFPSGRTALNLRYRPSGDFDGNSTIDVADVDALVAEIAAGTNQSDFDLNNDSAVDTNDLSQWLSDAATANGFTTAYVPGDANLDRIVNAEDLNRLAINWRQNVARWSGGDFTADGMVNSIDLNALALRWRQSNAASTTSIPESSSVWLLLPGLIAIEAVLLRRRGNTTGERIL